MAIKPISPVDREKLVPTDTSIIIEFTAMPAQVNVNGLTVFNGSSFQVGWNGSVINLVDGGKRMVLTPPSLFTVGQVIEVFVQETGGADLLYRFQTGVTQITMSDNASEPAITITPSADYYLGYVKEPGALFVRFTNPLSPEIQLISASVVDVSYDPNINKVVVFFVNNGRVYATVADPGDGPNTILPPGEASTPIKAVGFPFSNAEVSAVGGGSDYQEHSTFTYEPKKYLGPVDPVSVASEGGGSWYQAISKETFPPLKYASPVDGILVAAVVGGSDYGQFSGFPRATAPAIVSLDPIIVRIPRPTDVPETTLVVGFYLFKISGKTGSGRIIDYVALPEGEPWVEYTDPAATPNTTYAVIAVLRQGQSSGLVLSSRSAEDRSDLAGADKRTIVATGGGSWFQAFGR